MATTYQLVKEIYRHYAPWYDRVWAVFNYSFPENFFGCVIGRRYTKKYDLLPLSLPKTFSEKL
jgi:hypothetical protein